MAAQQQKRRDPRIEAALAEIVRRLVAEYQPEKIILFGSYAYGEPDGDSDLDMLIIKETSERRVDRMQRVLRLAANPNAHIPFEPIVLTPQELETRLEIGDQFVAEIVEKGELLYAARGCAIQGAQPRWSRLQPAEGRWQAEACSTESNRANGVNSMTHKDLRYPREWLAFAEKDLARVHRALRDSDPEIAGFLLQQATEKFLKAFLLAHGWKLVRTHNLGALLDEAVKHDPSLEQYRSVCLDISAYYLDSRYPAILTGDWSEQEVRDALRDVDGLVVAIRAALQPPQT